MSAIITISGENLIAKCQGQGRQLNIDKMIFANIPGIDPEAAIDRTSSMPEAGQIVQEMPIPAEYKAYVNPNQVVYSAVLDSDCGDYDFNWIGLYCTEDDTLVAITTLPTISKWKTKGQVQGNHLTRNFMLEFTGASECTGMSVAADTWQLDFSYRLKGIDERIRKSDRATYGRARFWKDGFKVANNAGVFHISKGIGYVEGIRIELEDNLPVPPEGLPKSVWLDVYDDIHGSELKSFATPAYGDNLADYEKDGRRHYLIKIADIDLAGNVSDLRTFDNIETDLVDYLKKQVTEHNLDPDAHHEIFSRLATGIPEITSPADNATQIGETPAFTCSDFVPVYMNTALDAMHWQIDYETQDFSTPVYDSGIDKTHLKTLTLPQGYLQVKNTYKIRCRRRINTGLWSPWSECISFTTRDTFNYVARPLNVEPQDNAVNVLECPILRAGNFSIIGSTSDSHAASQFRVNIASQTLHESPEISDSYEYKLPSGLLVVSSDYTFQCRHKGAALGWSEWSVPTSFTTASAFITGDEAIYPVRWDGHDNATADGVATAENAELRSNGTDQGLNEADWMECVVKAKVRGEGLEILEGTTANQLVTSDEVLKGEKLITNLGIATIEAVSTLNTMTKDDADPFGDNSCMATYQFNGSGVSLGPEGDAVTEGIVSYVDGQFGQGATIARTNTLSGPSINIDTGYAISFWVTSGIASSDDCIMRYTPRVNDEQAFGFLMDTNRIVGPFGMIYGQTWVANYKDGQPHHVVFSTTSDAFYCYVDGVKKWSAPNPGGLGTVDFCQFGYGAAASDMFYNQVRFFNRALTEAEISALFTEDKNKYTIDVSSANFSSTPTRAHKLPALTAATGSSGQSFNKNDFKKVPVKKAILGKDAAVDRPDFISLESEKYRPFGNFRRVAMGIKGMENDSESRVSECQIDVWKAGANTSGDEVLSPSSWAIHESASAEGIASADDAKLGSNTITQGTTQNDWSAYTFNTKVRSKGMEILDGSSASTLKTTEQVAQGEELLTDQGRAVVQQVEVLDTNTADNVDPFSDGSCKHFIPFTETSAIDLITDKNWGTIASGETGKYGKCWSKDTRYLAGSTSISPSINVPLTISYWYCCEAGVLPTKCLAYGAGFRKDDNAWRWFLPNNRSVEDASIPTLLDSTQGSWNNILFELSSAETKIYLNGQLIKTIAQNNSATQVLYSASNESFHLGNENNASMDQVRVFNKILTEEEKQQLLYENRSEYKYTLNSPLPAIPSQAYVIPALTAVTGGSSASFASADFAEIPVARAVLGKDSDSTNPDFIYLESAKQYPAEPFRKIAVGVDSMTKDSECRVSECRVDAWKSDKNTDDPETPATWAIHENATEAGVATADNAILGSAAVNQGAEEPEWSEYSVVAKVRDAGLNILSATANELVTATNISETNVNILTDLGDVKSAPVAGKDSSAILDIFGDGSCVDCFPLNDSNVGLKSGSTAPVNSYIAGKWDKGANIGASHIQTINPESNVTFRGTTPISINNMAFSMWAKSVQIHGYFFNSFASYSGSDRCFFGLGGDNKYIYMGQSGNSFATDAQHNRITEIFSDGAWHHFCVSIGGVNGTNVRRMYIDGELVIELNAAGFLSTPVFFAGFHYGQTIDQLRIFNRGISHDEVKRLFTEKQFKIDITAANFTAAPTKAHKVPALTAATGAANATFTGTDFNEIPVAKATLGKDSDANRPDYIQLESVKQTSATGFRSAALGVKNLTKDSECRVAECRINTWEKLPYGDGNESMTLTRWDVHENATDAGAATADNAILCSNGIDQGADQNDWGEYAVVAKVRDKGLSILDGTTASFLKTADKVVGGDKLVTDQGKVIAGAVNINTSSDTSQHLANVNSVVTGGSNGFRFYGNPIPAGREIRAIIGHARLIGKTKAVIGKINPEGIFEVIQLGDKFNSTTAVEQHPITPFLVPEDGSKYYVGFYVIDGWNSTYAASGRLIRVYEPKLVKGWTFDTNSGAKASSGATVFGELHNYHVVEGYVYRDTTYTTDISAANFSSAPTKAYKMPTLTGVTGAEGTAFTKDDFVEIPVESAILGKDSDSSMPDYMLLKSAKQSPTTKFRRVAMGISEMQNGSECRITECHIDAWKALNKADDLITPSSWEVHENASSAGAASADGAVLCSNGTDQDTDKKDWGEFAVEAKVRGAGLTVLSGTTNSLLCVSDIVREGEKLLTDQGVVFAGTCTSQAESNLLPIFPSNTQLDSSGGRYSYTHAGVTLATDSATYADMTDPLNTQMAPWKVSDGVSSGESFRATHGENQSGRNPLYVSFSSEVEITRIDMTTYELGNFEVATSTDGTNFTTVGTISSSGGSINLKTQYLRLREETPASGTTGYIYEMQVIGVPAQTNVDISSANLNTAPSKAYKMPELTGITGVAGTAFTKDNFVEIPVESTVLGKDSDPNMPDYMLLKSSRKHIEDGFRRVAMGVDKLAKDHECRVADCKIITWEKGE